MNYCILVKKEWYKIKMTKSQQNKAEIFLKKEKNVF